MAPKILGPNQNLFWTIEFEPSTISLHVEFKIISINVRVEYNNESPYWVKKSHGFYIKCVLAATLPLL